MSKAAEKVSAYKNAIEFLQANLKPGDKVYTKIESVARSGMSRVVSVYIVADNQIKDITYFVSCVSSYSLTSKGLRVSGCGFDAGFDVVYHLGSILWPNGTPHPHGTRNGEPDTSGGYALKHEWL